MDNYTVTPEAAMPQKSAIAEYKELLTSAFASPLFLVLTIALSINPVVSLASMLMTGFDIFTLLILCLPALTAVGCWILWANASKGTISAGTFSLVTCLPTYIKIVLYVIAILIALVFVLLFATAGLVPELIEELPYEVIAEIEMSVPGVLDLLEGGFGAIIGILAILFFIIEAAFVLLIIRYTYLTRLIKKMKLAINDNKIRPVKKPMFFVVVSFIYAAIILGDVLLMINGANILTTVSNISGVVSVSLVPIMLLINKNKWTELYAKQENGGDEEEESTSTEEKSSPSDYQTLA